MRMFSLAAAIAIVACAHQSANVPEPAAAATPDPSAATPEAAAPTTATSVAAVTPAPAIAAPAPSAVERRAVQTANAPKAVGPYSPAIQVPAGRALFLSAQIAVDP